MSWAGGGSSATRLSDWLDPAGTGAVTLGLHDPQGVAFTVSPAQGFESAGVAGGPFAPVAATYTLANTGDIPAPFQIEFPVDWLTADPAAGTIPVGGQVEVVVAIGPAATALAVGTYQTAVQFFNATLGQASETRTIRLRVLANVPSIVGVAPNPFSVETEIRFTLGAAATARARIYDVRGRLVRDLGTMAGQAGANFWVWDGKNGRGARAPSGVYGFVMTAVGHEVRTNIVLIH